MNLWVKIYIICQISLLQLQKWGHTMVYTVGKKEKNCFHVLSWLLFLLEVDCHDNERNRGFFATCGPMRGYIREKFPSFFSKLFSLWNYFPEKMCIAEAVVAVQSMAVILINDTTVKSRPFGFHLAHQRSAAWLLQSKIRQSHQYFYW